MTKTKKNSPPSYTVTNDAVTVILGGESFTIKKGSKNFDAARRAILDERWADLPNLVSPGRTVQQWLGKDFTFVDHFICYKGEKIDSALNDRLLKMVEEGADPTGWLKFWTRLQANPSYRSVNQLYAFLTHKGIPIDEKDGHILAYKSVRRDYKDHHSGNFDNSPGVTHEMARNKISDDPNVACHEGFHVGALEYASSFGGHQKRIVICKVDPADVVCVPYDHSAMKVRVCKYTVLGNYSGSRLPDTTYREDEDENDGYDNMPERRDVSDEELAGTETELPDLDGEGEWSKYNAMSEGELLDETIKDLRRYATHGLKIVRAGKIPGGKQGLVDRILEVRK
jgi:hypothetical protein